VKGRSQFSVHRAADFRLNERRTSGVGGPRNAVSGPGVALHDALPVPLAVDRGIARLRADRRRVEQDLGALEGHGAGGLGEPLVPADADADRRVRRAPDAEAGVAGIEIELLLIARAVGNVRLAIEPELPAVGVDHHQRVVVGIVGPLEEADRQHDLQLLRDFRQPPDRGILGDGQRQLEVLNRLILPSQQAIGIRQRTERQRLSLAIFGVAEDRQRVHLARSRVDRNDEAVGGGVVDKIAIDRERLRPRRERRVALVFPQQRAVGGVERRDRRARLDHVHDAAIHDGNTLVVSGRHFPGPRRLQPADVPPVDELERAETLRVVRPAVHQPVVWARVLEHLRRHAGRVPRRVRFVLRAREDGQRGDGGAREQRRASHHGTASATSSPG